MVSEHEQHQIKEGWSAGKALVFLGLVWLIPLCIGFYFLNNYVTLGRGLFSPRHSATSDPRVNPTVAAPAAVKKVTAKDLPKAAPPEKPKDLLSHFSVTQQRSVINVNVNGKSIKSISLPYDSRYWIGVVNDPYAPLVNLAGTPFFDGTNLPIKPSDNIVPLINSDRKVITDKDIFKPFSFFSEHPTTIGFAEGFYDMKTYEARLVLTFANLADGRFVIIESSQMSFPEWFRKGGYPPAYALDKFIYLAGKSKGYGDNVYVTLKRYKNGAYGEDREVLRTLYEREFQKAQLSDQELAILKNGNIRINDFRDELYKAVRTVTRYCYYAQKLGRGDLVNALLPKLHSSIQEAIRNNSMLNR